MTKPPRPRLALPFTVLTAVDTVRLVAGEDFRYTLNGPGLDRWLPGLLALCDGRRTLNELLNGLVAETKDKAKQVLDRLYAERVLVDGTAQDAHVATAFHIAVEGSGALADALNEPPAADAPRSPKLQLLCQDRLDYEEALQFNRRCLKGHDPWMWATTGPMSRGYVSPPFLPGAGPCLACLIRHFQRLSPASELYDALIDHGRQGRAFEPVPFPEQGIGILKELVRWKLGLLPRSDPPAVLYRLHVLEVETMEVTAHRVFLDPECPECGHGGVV